MLKRFVLKISTFLLLVLSVAFVFVACGKMEFKVDFIVDDAVYATINTNGEEVLKMPNDPEKEGYVFDGWYWDKDSWKKPFSANSLLDAPLSSNMSVYAKWMTPEQVKGTEAEFAEFEKISETEYSTKVSNSTTSLSLSALVTINSRSSWTLSTDIYGTQTIASRTATLNVGDNTYYVLVTAEDGSTQLYTLKIRRKPMYTVIFDTAGGTSVENQKVEEDALAVAPQSTREGYDFSAWNFDFTTPITENKIIVASWTAKEYTITYNTAGGDIANATTKVIYDSEYTLEIPTRRGYEFLGWYLESDKVENGTWKTASNITLLAKWDICEYSISYDLKGGSVAMGNPVVYTVESDNIILTAPTRVGFTFLGWTGTDISQPTMSVIIHTGSIGNKEYVANWDYDGYDITYHLDGGTNHENNPDGYNIDSANIYLENPTREGYIFGGWYTSNAFDAASKITVITMGSTGDKDLYAKWTPITYTVKFNKNASSATGTMNDQAFEYNKTQSLTSNLFARVGYTFVGWTTNADGTGTAYNNANEIFNLSATQGDVITLYAKWEANTYSVTLDRNGSNGGTDSVTATFGSAMPEATAPNPYVGYTFDGYYDAEGVQYYDSTMASVKVWDKAENSTLYARWVANTITVTFDKQNGTVGTNAVNATFASAMPIATAPTRTGYTFAGYFSEPNGQGTQYYNESMESVHNWDCPTATTLYAAWDVNTYNVSFDANGGSVQQNNIVATYDASMPGITATPTRTGYIFLGYYDSANGGTKYYNADLTSAKAWNKTSSATLYAHWEAITYNVVFNANTGSGTMTNQQIAYDASVALKANAFNKTGYAFLCWNTKADGTGTKFNNNESVKNLLSADNASITLYAQWVAVDYTITYRLNGGTNNPNNINGFTIEDADIELLAPSKDGYTFGGWYTDSNFTTAITEIEAGTHSNVTVYAKWNIVTYTITYHPNGGNNNINAVEEFTVETNTFTLLSPSREGYTFRGWYTDASFANSITQIQKGTHDDIVLYANWTANNYTVTFNKNASSATGTMSVQTLTYNTSANLSSCGFARTGYTFAGWSTNSNGTGTVYANTEEVLNLTATNNANINLYAIWTKNTYTITFDKQGGTGGSDNVTATFDNSMPSATAPTLTGYNFEGYFDADGNQYYTASMVSVRSWDKATNTTLYARYEGKTFTVTLDKQNGTGGSSSVAATYESSMPSATAPSRTGYTFKGYFDQPNGAGVQYYSASMSSLRAWDKASAATLYAHWQANSYSVSFNANSGSGASSSKTATYDSAMPTITAAPTRTGYIFLGYFDASSGGTKYYNADLSSARTWNKTSNTTLYAHWEAITYTVKFDANGGSGTMADQEFTYGISNSLISNAFTRTGYTFAGWTTNANGTGTSYTNTQSVSNLANTEGAEVVIYAKWTANNYTVTLDETQVTTTVTTPSSYTVSFNLNGASGTAPLTQTVTSTTGLAYPSVPKRSGYAFAGWYKTSSCTGTPYDFSATVSENTTLYAKWVSMNSSYSSREYVDIVNYSSSSNKKSVTASSYSSYNYYYFTCYKSGTYTIYANWVEGDYKFNVSNVTSGSTIISDFNLYDSSNNKSTSKSFTANAGDVICVRTIRYSSSYNYTSNGTFYVTGASYPTAGGKATGSTTTSTTTVDTKVLTFGSNFTLPVDVSKVGHTFAGWYDGVGGTGTQYTDASGNSVRVWDKAGDTMLYPKWIANEYTITFVSNGGSPVSSITQDFGTTVTAPTNPTWSEKSFVGWFDSTLTTQYEFTTMPAGDFTLYAKWVDYEVTLTATERTEISINEGINANTFRATAVDTDGNPVTVTATIISGTYEIGNTITVRLVATGLYGIYDTKTISGIQVHGAPLIVYNETKDFIKMSDTINASLFGATATDTYGTSLSVNVSVKEGTYSAGDLVTIVLKATDATNNETVVEIENVKVYGAPVITRDTSVVDMKATDTISSDYFGATAVDSFGVPLTVTTTKYSGTFAGGYTITVKSSATDSKGNTNYITYSIKVYGTPTITAASTTTFKVTDDITLSALGIVAKDSFGNVLSNVTLELTEGIQQAGSTLKFLVTATDHLGNVQTRTISGIKIYGTPEIEFNSEKTKINATDTINASLFGATATDSFGASLNVTVALETGTFAGGNVATFRISATDHLGNTYYVVTPNVNVYSSSDINLTYNSAAASYIKKTSNGAEFYANATNSFGENCTITLEAASGYTIAGGKTINLYLVATDCMGNTTKSALISGIKVYDMPTMSYARDYDYIQNGDSPYALFSVKDSFGNELLFDVEVISGSLTVNETIVYRISATDRAGNFFSEEYELVVLATNESILELYVNGEFIGTQRVNKNGNFTLPCETGYYTVWYFGSTAITGNTGNSLSAWSQNSNGYVVTATPVPITYSISYSMNSGTNSSSNPSTYNIESGNITLVQPTRTGYTFVGWTGTGLDERTMTVVIPTGSYGNITYTANWEANDYTVSFNANGGTVNESSKTVTYNASYTLPKPTRTGYTFAGWYNGETKYSNGTWKTANNVSLRAKWTANTNTAYKVNHYQQNIEDDNYTLYATQNLTGTSDASVAPIVNTYTGFTSPSTQTVTINPDGSRVVNYYYTRNYYTVTVVGNGGTNNTIRQKYQSAIDTTGWTTRDGYTLGGLYNDLALTSVYSDTTMPAQDKTVYAYWEGESLISEFAYTSTSSAITIKGYTGSSTIVKIPTQIGGIPVTAIAANVFANNTTLVSVVVPNSVESIGAGAFKGCDSLTSVSLPFVGKSRTARAYEAVFGYVFGYTTATRNTYNYEYTTSGSQWGSSSRVSSSNNDFVDRIVGTYDSVYLPAGTTWQYSCRNGYYSSYYYLQSYYYYVPSTLTSVVITDATVIPEEAFYNCANITSVTLNNGVTTIGTNAFENCTKLATVNIGTGITTISADAFKNCSALTSITVPYGVNTMGANAFVNCSSLSINCQIEEQPSAWASTWNSSSRPVTWGYGCERGTTSAGLEWISIDGETVRIVGYKGTSSTLTIPATIDGKVVNRIAANAFAGNTTLTSVVIPDSIVCIEKNAFQNCTALTSVTIADSVTEIQANVFTGCTKVSLLCEATSKPSGWASSWNSNNRPVVWKYAGSTGTSNGLKWALVSGNTVVIYGYSGSSASITLPTTISGKTVSGISENAFRSNTTITSVFIPSCIEYIGSGAFVGCSKLTINCEVASAPSGWSSSWKDSSTTVYWSM